MRIKVIILLIIWGWIFLVIGKAEAKEPLYILPITLNGFITESVEVTVENIKNDFGVGGTDVRVGFSVGFPYLDWTNSDGTTDMTNVEKAIEVAKRQNMPLLFHLNGHRWSELYHQPEFVSDRNVWMMTQDGKAVTEVPEWSDMGKRVGSMLWSLNIYNRKYLDFKQARLEELGRRIVIFQQERPDLFAGVSLDSEVALCGASLSGNYDYNFDWNPYTIAQYRYWLTGEGGVNNYPTLDSGYYNDPGLLNPYGAGGSRNGLGLNLTLEQLRQRYGINIPTWHNVFPPRWVAGNDFSSQTWKDWLSFKSELTNMTLENMVEWLKGVGLPESKIYTHQAVENVSSDASFCGISADSNLTRNGGGYGVTLYYQDALNLGLLNKIFGYQRKWGIFEWSLGNESSDITYNNLNDMQSRGLAIVCPNYYYKGGIESLNNDPFNIANLSGMMVGIKRFVDEKGGAPFPSPSPSFTTADLKNLLTNYTNQSNVYHQVDNKINMMDASWVIKWIH